MQQARCAVRFQFSMKETGVVIENKRALALAKIQSLALANPGTIYNWDRKSRKYNLTDRYPTAELRMKRIAKFTALREKQKEHRRAEGRGVSAKLQQKAAAKERIPNNEYAKTHNARIRGKGRAQCRQR